jgi:PAS domain S-box-containing protein
VRRGPDDPLSMTPKTESSPQRYRDLVEQGRGLICTHDLAGVLLSVNRAAADRLGYAPEELVGRSLRDLLAPAVRHLFPHYLDRIQRAPEDEGLMVVVTRDGEERIWTYSNVRGRDAGGAEYVLGHAHDITDIKRSDARAGEAEALRSVGQLALATAHEINNPLTVIIASLQLMVARGQVAEEAAGYVQRAIKSAEQIRDIVRNMSRITKLELSRQAPQLPPVLDLQKSAGAPPTI